VVASPAIYRRGLSEDQWSIRGSAIVSVYAGRCWLDDARRFVIQSYIPVVSGE
jgi:hypothetical protein